MNNDSRRDLAWIGFFVIMLILVLHGALISRLEKDQVRAECHRALLHARIDSLEWVTKESE